MSDEKPIVKVSHDSDSWTIALAILIVFFNGEPDLCGALIHYLMQAKP